MATVWEKQKLRDPNRKGDRARSAGSRNGNMEGHHQKIVEWVCGTYVAKGEVWGGSGHGTPSKKKQAENGGRMRKEMKTDRLMQG